jgi:pyruvate/oxaloacetate carboxyltransferase
MCVKDPTGLLTPERGRTLFPVLVKAAGGIPLQLHSHCQSGLAPEVYTVAMQAGFEYAYTRSSRSATAPRAHHAGNPPARARPRA